MKTIIVPVDFSNYSEYALKVAASIAKTTEVSIIVLHMLDTQSDSVNESPSYTQQRTIFLLELAKKKFKTFLDKDYLKGIKVTPIVKHYKIFSDINEIAKDENADLIAVSTHGRKGLTHLFTGSISEDIANHATLPILTIKI